MAPLPPLHPPYSYRSPLGAAITGSPSSDLQLPNLKPKPSSTRWLPVDASSTPPPSVPPSPPVVIVIGSDPPDAEFVVPTCSRRQHVDLSKDESLGHRPQPLDPADMWSPGVFVFRGQDGCAIFIDLGAATARAACDYEGGHGSGLALS
jgi:hypothetical protein